MSSQDPIPRPLSEVEAGLFVSTAPKVLDLLVAVVMGVAGAFALVRRDVADIVAAAGRSGKALITVLVVALVVPLTVTSVRTYRYQSWMKATEVAARLWVARTGWRVTDVHQSGDEIVATVIRPGDPPPLDALQTMVRRSVPDSVTVRIVKDSGETTDL